VEGPACEKETVQGLLKENVTAGPWISDLTAVDARVRGEPRRELGARVHGGPHRKGYPHDLTGAVDQRSNDPGRVQAGGGGELEGEGEATVQELGNGGGSGGALVWSGRGS
jgi:hypothetical protein